MGFGAEPDRVAKWLGEQNWVRDSELPVVSLGAAGDFDDTHIFAPCVAKENGGYRLWYCGSRGSVAERVFRLGLATSDDGVRFEKFGGSPVFGFGDGQHSVLTPTLLRAADGGVLRENGKLRMWFSATHFSGGSGLHTLHETISADGVRWAKPSAAQLEHVYAPTILKEGPVYHLWYTDVSEEPWRFRYGRSSDGRKWAVRDEAVMLVDQGWEKGRLFYPTVLKADGVYLMWYGSYWSAESNKTAIGFAVSGDGVHWRKHPGNPVFRPDAKRAWESHYTTSQSVIREADGRFRIWYASRKAPPFENKYFAIGTARWTGREDR
jgi:predicted GH43/DUF377 family glycosyl hydrolase